MKGEKEVTLPTNGGEVERPGGGGHPPSSDLMGSSFSSMAPKRTTLVEVLSSVAMPRARVLGREEGENLHGCGCCQAEPQARVSGREGLRP